MPLEEIKQIKSSKDDLRKWGLTAGIALLVLGVFLFFKQSGTAVYWGGTGLILIAASFAVPLFLKPFNIVWMTLAILLGWVMTRALLVVFFYVLLTPMGLMAKLLGKDLLDRKTDKGATSYWRKKEKGKFDPRDYERQF